MRVTRVLHRLWRPIALIGSLYTVCVTGFVLTQHVAPFDGIYWGVVTMSTVGYGDVVPTNTVSKLFAMILAGSTIGILGYVISSISALTLQAREEEMLGLDGTDLQDHVVLLGWTPVSRAALQELLLGGRKVAVMTRRQETLTEIRTFATHLIRKGRSDPRLRDRVSDEKDLFVALGDYSHGSALSLLNLPKASEAIVASDDDARNVMTALILKEVAPHLRVVVAVLREELRETLHAAGVTYVISPAELGGRMISAAAIQPEVAQTFDDLTTSSYHYNVDEFPLVPPNPLVGKSFDEGSRAVRSASGATLVGVARPRPTSGDRTTYEVVLSPPPESRLEPGWYVLAIAGSEQRAKLLSWIGVMPGRPPSGPRR